MRILCLLLALAAAVGAAGCRDSNAISPIPDVYVNEQVYLNTLQAQPLRIDGGAIGIGGGVRGIIVYHETGDTYRAFDRCCTHDPQAACAIVRVAAIRTVMEDTCCKSQFDFFGRVTAGPAPAALRPYQVVLEGGVLYITNPDYN